MNWGGSQLSDSLEFTFHLCAKLVTSYPSASHLLKFNILF